MKPFTFDPVTIPADVLWQFISNGKAYNLKLITMTVELRTLTVLSISGLGVLHIDGATDTSANWNFSAVQNNGNITFSMSCDSLTSLPADVLLTISKRPSQPTYGDLPAKEYGKDSLILVTHGWQLNVENLGFPQPDVSFVDSMSNNISTYLLAHEIGNWQVYGYKWVNNAWVWNPSDALNNAKKEGVKLGTGLLAQGWKHVHFIAHSAGANLIQSATDVIKNPTTGSPSTIVHETFLDPFVGTDFSGVITYGRGANWADQYFSRDEQTEIDPFVSLFSIAPYTESPVYHSYNVDVTPLDPHKTSYLKFASSPNGAQIEETCNDTETTHGWPIAFYTNTIVGNVTSDYLGFGFPLSEEGGNWSAALGYAAGNGTDLNPASPTKMLGTPDSVCTVVGQLSPPSYPNITPDPARLPSVDSGTGTVEKWLQSLQLNTGSPVWTALFITSTNPVNFVSFNARFVDTNGAEGLLSVLWDTNTVGTVDERLTPSGFQHYSFTFQNAIPNTTHALGFRLDPFTSVQSSMLLTNIVLNQVGVSQPFYLSMTTNLVNGLRVMRLDGEPGFSYNVQTIADLADTNWTDIAILANTNGTVFFYDERQNNFAQRFYRVVTP